MAAFLAGLPALAQEPVRSIDEALKKVLGDAKPTESGITLEIPEIAENGNTVPFTLAVDSPMTDASHVKAVHVFACGKPQVGVASSASAMSKSRSAAAAAEAGIGSENDVSSKTPHPYSGKGQGRRGHRDQDARPARHGDREP
ncbi:MAG: hypothetical protein J0I75_11630 [Hyphomicrobium sp.]|nr:hypothetical protein [Hyphomicrobium sp.]